MKTKRIYLIPIIVSLVAILASIVAFQKSSELDQGTLYLDGNPKEIVFDGEYYLLLGNLGQVSETISIVDVAEGVLITVYDVNDEIWMQYTMMFFEENSTYDSSIINSINVTEKNDVDEITEHLLTLNLEKGKSYVFTLEQTENHINQEDIDAVFVNVPEQIINMKSLMENVAYTSGIFAILSLLTIWAVKYVKKDS